MEKTEVKVADLIEGRKHIKAFASLAGCPLLTKLLSSMGSTHEEAGCGIAILICKATTPQAEVGRAGKALLSPTRL